MLRGHGGVGESFDEEVDLLPSFSVRKLSCQQRKNYRRQRFLSFGSVPFIRVEFFFAHKTLFTTAVFLFLSIVRSIFEMIPERCWQTNEIAKEIHTLQSKL